MPISTASEFEAVVAQAVIKISKVLYERGEIQALKDARRELDMLAEVARDADKLKEKRVKITEIAEVIRANISRDEDLLNDMWDLLDYVDYGL